MTRPRLLDLFCGAGGATMGYHRAGFEVTGVDEKPQPRYPFEFVQADAMTYPLDGFDVIHASPPCRDHTCLANVVGTDGSAWMLAATRERLTAWGGLWVIENVSGAPMASHIILCGTMFGLGTEDLELRRHRLFETSGLFCLTPPCQHCRRALTVAGHGGGADGTVRRGGVRGTLARAPEARQAMGIDWMTVREISQAIPPAYTEFIGRQLIEHLAGIAA